MFELSEVNKYDTVLDVACGPGLVTTAFATKANMLLELTLPLQ